MKTFARLVGDDSYTFVNLQHCLYFSIDYESKKITYIMANGDHLSSTILGDVHSIANEMVDLIGVRK